MKRARSDEAKDERRALLLQAALDEFFEKGFSAARMSDIARRANLTKGTLYLYFESKDALFKALIERLAAPNLDHMEMIASSAPTFSDALDRLADFAPFLIRQSDMPRLMKVLIGDSHNFPGIILAYREEVLGRLLDIIARVLEQAKAAGEIDFENAQLTARLVMAPIALSGMWQALFGKDKDAAVDLETLFRMHADNMRRALQPRRVR